MPFEKVKAAKPHTCHWCSTEIEKGSMYYMSEERRSITSPIRTRQRFHNSCFASWRADGMPQTPGNNPRPPEPGFTIIVRRTTRAASVTVAGQIIATNIFVCRVEGTTSDHARDVAIAQAFAYDRAEYKLDPKKYHRAPSLEYYEVAATFPGYPSLTRPE